jgi:hypothetical protein
MFVEVAAAIRAFDIMRGVNSADAGKPFARPCRDDQRQGRHWAFRKFATGAVIAVVSAVTR